MRNRARSAPCMIKPHFRTVNIIQFKALPFFRIVSRTTVSHNYSNDASSLNDPKTTVSSKTYGGNYAQLPRPTAYNFPPPRARTHTQKIDPSMHPPVWGA